MIYLTAQPNRVKFYWQLKVQIENFKEMGINLSDVHVLIGCDTGDMSDLMKSLEDTGVKLFGYSALQDYRYIPSVRPNIIAQHFEKYPELSNEYIFYMDCDVIFNRLPDYSQMNLDGTWYVSDTISYIGAKYIKGKTILNDMCKIVGIHPDLVKSKENESGGCQYIMTGTDKWFWKKVEKDCIELFTSFPNRWNGTEYEGTNQKKYKELGETPIQIWCADMWAVLWNAWLRGFTTIVHKELEFSWATDCIASFCTKPIFHLAGVTGNEKGQCAPHFNKGTYDNKIPFNEDFSWVNNRSATYKYIEYFNKIKQ